MKVNLVLTVFLGMIASASTVATAAEGDSVKAAVKEKPAVDAPIVPQAKITGFEIRKTPMEFGWMVVTDTVMGGTSTGEATIVPDGANGSKQSLKITGKVIAKNPYIMFSGAATRFGKEGKSIYDFSGFTGIKFWAKGDSNTYKIELPCAAVTDYMFHYSPFTPTKEWKEYKVPFAGLKQMPYGQRVVWTGKDVRGVEFFTVMGPIDSFTLQVDELEFYK